MAAPRDAEIRKDVQVPAEGPGMAKEGPRLSGSIRPLEAQPACTLGPQDQGGDGAGVVQGRVWA